MNIPESIKQQQIGLSQVNGDFLQYVHDNPEALKSANFKTLDLHDGLFRLQPWPTFIDPVSKEFFAAASVPVLDLIKSIPKRIFDNDASLISQYYGIPENSVKLQLDGLTDEHLGHLLGRGDYLIHDSRLLCLEYNVSANLGGWQIPTWEMLYLKTPVIDRFLRQYQVKVRNQNMLYGFLEHAYQSASHRFGEDGDINIIIINKNYKAGTDSPMQMYLDQLYQQLLRNRGRAGGGKLLLGDFQQLEKRGQFLYCNDRPIHVVTELYNGFVSPDVLQTFKDKAVILMNGPITFLLSSKLNLAILSDDKNAPHFSKEEQAIIQQFIPWTRRTKPGETQFLGETIQLESFVSHNRERFVLKPSLQYGGEGVTVGIKVNQTQWQEMVKQAFQDGSWVVQEYIPSSSGWYQAGDNDSIDHDMVWGVFVFGSHYTGTWLRVMPNHLNKGVINCHQGASVSIIFETDR
jgi:hypothetical protein